VMHSLAIALKRQGHEVSGSDDKIYDPAFSRLQAEELIPDKEGWHPDRIHADLDAIILGMHAFEDNPELKKAQELELPIYSFPEFIYHQSAHKQRIVVAGSYGKTTVTAMIMHVLQAHGKKFDYLVGAQVDGFDNSVRLSDTAPLIVLEGDEYLASKLDPRPKFLHYRPHVTVVTGISWDHINVFPTEDIYEEQFTALLESIAKAGDIIYNEGDARLRSLVETYTDANSQYRHPYQTPKYKVKDGVFEIRLAGERSSVPIIGRHNMANMAAAWQVCRLLSVTIEEFIAYMQSFKGASIRLEIIRQNGELTLIRDYAHAPAKVRASVNAVRESKANHNLIACVELHTFSSLNEEFLPLYKQTLKGADHKIVFVDPRALERKRMPPITREQLVKAFGDQQLIYATSPEELAQHIGQVRSSKDVVLMMSSGNFAGLDLEAIN
ncbi:MAG: Mur ligase family protein, partial [Bacteroidota bacterium]